MPTERSRSHVLITGGADGLGRALALRYAEEGHCVIILDVDEARGRCLAAQGEGIVFIPLNLAAFEVAGLNLLSDSFDIVICNAGISVSGDFREISFEAEKEVFEVNVLGHIKLLKLLLQSGRIRRGARLAFVLSASVYLPFPVALAYAASKAALEGFANALEPYLWGERISVTRVYPGPMKTAHQAKYYVRFASRGGTSPRKVARSIVKQAKYYVRFASRGGTSPRKVARSIVKAVKCRRRRVFPDAPSRLCRIAWGVSDKMLTALSYKFCKRYPNTLFEGRESGTF